MSSAPPHDPVVAYFDAHAAAYDRQLWLERWALGSAARMAAAAPGERVLDVATGTGAVAEAVLRTQPSLGALTVVDAAPHMLARARGRLAGAAVTPRYVQADAHAIPLDDRSIDLATAGYLFHLLSPGDRREVLAEIVRIVRPGGRVVVIVHGTPPGPLGGLYRAGWHLVDRLLPNGLVGGGPMRDVATDLAGAGLRIEAARRIPGVYWSHVVAARR